MVSIRRIQTVREQFATQLLAQPNVVSVGLGRNPTTGEQEIVIGVRAAVAEQTVLPAGFPADVPTRVEVVGEVRALSILDSAIARGYTAGPRMGGRDLIVRQEHADRVRPIPAGISVGVDDNGRAAGTTSFLCVDDTGAPKLTSNNHVIADNEGPVGRSVFQPATDSVAAAELEDWVTIEDGVTTDAAWATPLDELTHEVYNVGFPTGPVVDPSLGDEIIKSGRTTGVTTGTVELVDADVKVDYGELGTIVIHETFATGNISQAGDSGSPTLIQSTLQPVGILFAGSSERTFYVTAVNWELETGLTIVTEQDTGTTDPALVTVDACGFTPQDAAPSEEVAFSAVVSNGNDSVVSFDVVWDASTDAGTGRLARVLGASLGAGEQGEFTRRTVIEDTPAWDGIITEGLDATVTSDVPDTSVS